MSRGGADGAEGVVLVGDRDAEDRHHGVADELLHGAAVALDRRGHRREVPEHHAADAPPGRAGPRAPSSP